MVKLTLLLAATQRTGEGRRWARVTFQGKSPHPRRHSLAHGSLPEAQRHVL